MAALALAITAVAGPQAIAQGGRGQAQGGPPSTARAAAPVDLTGYWVSVVTEDWRYRMVTPPKGDYQSVPISAEGRRVADTWDPSKDGACEAYGAAGLMRMPGRLHITWEDDNTLKIETDGGQQTRLLHFGASRPPGGQRTLQGYSAADWGRGSGGASGGFGGFGGNVTAPDAAPARGADAGAAAPAPAIRDGGPPPPAGRGGGGPQRWAPLNVVTTQLRPGWLRKNGVPYSENTVLTEHFVRFSDERDEWFTVVTIVEDPTYLTMSFITSTNFKREPDGARWKPTPCKVS
jgi:hypothetical protein